MKSFKLTYNLILDRILFCEETLQKDIPEAAAAEIKSILPDFERARNIIVLVNKRNGITTPVQKEFLGEKIRNYLSHMISISENQLKESIKDMDEKTIKESEESIKFLNECKLELTFN